MELDAVTYPGTFSISKRPTFKQRLRESRPLVVFFAAFFIVGFALPSMTSFFAMPLWLLTGNFFAYTFAMFAIGVVLTFGVIFTVRAISRRTFGSEAKRIEALEQRLSTGSPDVLADLDALISANLRAGRAAVAEFYSRQILTICERDRNEEIRPEIMLSTPCWVSTPEYHQSVNYWMVWLYESRGLLCMSKHHLEYESSRIAFRVDLKDIVDISIERHPWWLKPYPLHFIRITFREPDFGSVISLNVSPYTMQTDTVMDINKQVKDWYSKLTKQLGAVEQV